MKNKVIIKGNRYGISIVLDPDVEFDELLKELEVQLEQADRFFDSDKQIAAAFEGRDLSNDELDKVLSVIQNESKLNIRYIIDENSNTEKLFETGLSIHNNEKVSNMNYNSTGYNAIQSYTISENSQINDNNTGIKDNSFVKTGQSENIFNDSDGSIESGGLFYKGTLRSGQKLEAEDSVVIIGDVNPGASVVAGGNIVIIGSLTGSVQAGAKGNRGNFVMALSMDPIQIQIADIIARSSDKKHTDKKNSDIFRKDKRDKKSSKQDAMIATVIDNHIYMESISKNALSDLIV